jgi:hypothetical protein
MSWGIAAVVQGDGGWRLVALGGFGAVAIPAILIWRRDRRTPQGYGRRQVYLITATSALLGVAVAVYGAIQIGGGEYRGLYLLVVAACAFAMAFVGARALVRGWGREDR